MNNSKFTIITFYQFKITDNLEKQKTILKDFCFFHKIRGTILIANEGINGTLAGLMEPIELLLKEFKKIGFENLELKYSSHKYMPFNRLIIKIKKEIITFNGVNLNIEKNTGKHIKTNKWNSFIRDKKTLVIDVRNDFENKIGSFKGAVNPKTKNFSEFKNYVDNILSKNKKKNIAMFCTGGIRCEKASSYMISKGFNNIYQLKGGILKYLADIPKEKSTWEGECFVFDNRVSVQNELVEGTYELCHGCRYPLSIEERKSSQFIEGITCPKCYDKVSVIKKLKLEERNKQIKISKKRGLYNPYIKFTPANFY